MVYYYQDDDEDLTYRSGGSVHQKRKGGADVSSLASAQGASESALPTLPEANNRGNYLGETTPERAAEMREMRADRDIGGDYRPELEETSVASGTDMGMSTAQRTSERAGGAEALFSGTYDSGASQGAMGGTYTPTVEQTSIPAQTESMGGAAGIMGGMEGGEGGMGSMMGQIGAQIGASDDEQDEMEKQLLMDDSDVQAMNSARAQREGGINPNAAQELLAKAKRFAG